MAIVVLLLFISLVLVLAAVLFFFFSAKNSDMDYSVTLSLLPLEEDDRRGDEHGKTDSL